MTEIRQRVLEAIQYLLTARVSDIVDMLIAAFIIYQIISLIRRTNSNRVAKGILFVLLTLWLSSWLQLTVLNYYLSRAVELGFLALVVLFQPELRRGLEKIGSQSAFAFLRGSSQTAAIEAAITQTVLACSAMSADRTGALIVFERVSPLENQIKTGTIVNADVTAELIKNIFYDKAPLHDGAIIVRDGRIAAAGCMLPLSSNTNLSRDLGMRHRAAIGISEHSDSVVAIVSEENGAISVAVDGMLKRHLTGETFEKILRNELMPDDSFEKPTIKSRIAAFFGGKNNG